MVSQVGHPIIPLLRDLEVGGDRLFLDCEGEGVAFLILVRILVPTIPLHFFEVFYDLV